MEAIQLRIKISHPSDQDAQKLFVSYRDQEILRPFCVEAEAAIPKEAPQRSMALVDAVVHSVYNESLAWSAFPPKQLFYTSSTIDNGLQKGLFETQKANNVFHNLSHTFKENPVVNELKVKKFTNAQQIYDFFGQKNLIAVHNSSGRIQLRKSSMPIIEPKPTHLSLRGCDMTLVLIEWLHDNLTSLDLSCNQLHNIDNVTLPASLDELDLSYNQFESVPNNLWSGVTRVSLRGNPIKQLGVFSGLASLTQLDIAYMGTENQPLELLEDFWKNIYNPLVIVISPGMQFKVPEDVQSLVTFINAQNNQRLPIVNGQVACSAEASTSQSTGVSTPSAPRKRAQSNAGPTLLKWLAIPMLALISYLGWKLWTRAKA